MTTVIGSRAATMRYLRNGTPLPGYNVLKIPPAEYTWSGNVSWLAEAYRRGDTFLILPQRGPKSNAELKLLKYWDSVGKQPIRFFFGDK